MRVLAGPIVSTGRSSIRAIGEGRLVETRARKGVAAFSTMVESSLPYRYAEQQRILTNLELWDVYKKVPDIRSAIDATVLKVSTWDWVVKSVLDPSDDRYELSLQEAEKVRKFLSIPNKDGETWQEFISKLTRDLLVFDALCIEHCFSGKGKLEELVAIRGGDVTPIVDKYQRIQFYKQINMSGQQVEFLPEEATYLNLFPNTTAPGGAPLIETLITELITLLRQAKNVMQTYDADEIAPGLLVLSGLAGKAAERQVTSLQNMRGNDSKLRVMTGDSGTVDAKWIEFRRTPKDLDLKDVVKEVRRTVWRLFHVKPITMGDSEGTPRATGEVQLQAEEEGLIVPFLELLEQKINARILPLIIGDPEIAAMITFGFDFEKKRTSKEEKDSAEADGADLDRGVLTVNERRHKLKLAPIQGGDEARVKTSQGWMPLGSPAEAAPAVPGADQAGGDGEVSDPEAKAPDAEEKAPGDVKKNRIAAPARASALKAGGFSGVRPGKTLRWLDLPLADGCRAEPEVSFREIGSSTLLPSDWQSTGKFKDYRTIDLQATGNAIVNYAKEVGPLYRAAKLECLAIVRSYLGDDQITEDELPSVLSRCTKRIDQLSSDWAMTTTPLYRQAARIGRDAVSKYAGDPSLVSDWQEQAATYQEAAMRYLIAEKGLLSDIKNRITNLIVVSARSKRKITRSEDGAEAAGAAVAADTVIGAESAKILATMRDIFDANEFRISNWSGKLLELASQVVTQGLVKTSAEGTDEQWYCEWVDVQDEAECRVCVSQGNKGFRPVSQLPFLPGSNQTDCKARCRCVLTFWTKEEVSNGKAVSLR